MTGSKKKITDPHAKREAAKYDSPIPSREFILGHLKQRNTPAKFTTICLELSLELDDEQEALRRRLNAMQRDGQLIRNRRGYYASIDSVDLLKGRVSGHRDGYGFFIPDDKSQDLFLTQRQMSKVFDGDRVLVRPSEGSQRNKKEAIILEVLERAHTTLVGRYFTKNSIGFVVPENTKINQDIIVGNNEETTITPAEGQIVIVELLVYPSGRANAVGKITQILGDHMAPGMEVEVALRANDIPFLWPSNIQACLDKITHKIHQRELNKRIDLRQLPFVTIDGADAKDFDDAVFCKPYQNIGWKLYVAIADVSHYVAVDSPLDQEAQQRGNSVYFPEHVVPMLPEVLSNDLCSLKPKVDRLVLVCEMTVNNQGEVIDYCFQEGIICSHARLTYTEVSEMLEHKDSTSGIKLRTQYASVVTHLESLFCVYKKLLHARQARGAIDFDSTETKIIFGNDRKIEKIVPVARNQAHRLIEECMLCANVAAANFLLQHKLDGLYRVHETPPAEKLTKLRDFLGELGLNLGGADKPSGHDYQRLSKNLVGRTDAHLIQIVMLRSMQQALYSVENKGHFGLSYPAYTHFTSPIRRYPDLLMHRALRAIIRSKRKSSFVKRTEKQGVMTRKQIYPYTLEDLTNLGEQCSLAERRAEDAVRDVVSWLKCEFMRDQVGEVFSGVISGVTAFGLFVELNDIYVEGLVHVSALKNDYYHFDANKHRLVGERTHFSYRLGDEVKIKIMQVNLESRRIDFELVDNNPSSRKKPKHKSKYKKRPKANQEQEKSKSNKGKPKRATLKAKNGSKPVKRKGKGK